MLITFSDTSWVSKETRPLHYRIWSAPSLCGLTLQTFTTTMAQPCGIAGRNQKAISELKTSVRLDPSAAASYALLGMAQRDEGDLAGAKVNLERALALSPTTAASFIDLGIVFLKQAQLQRALAQFEAGLNANSAVPTPDWDGAISALRDATSKGPDLPETHNMLGLLLGRKGADSNEVLAEFRQALRLRPELCRGSQQHRPGFGSKR